jgi:hypothetical protein
MGSARAYSSVGIMSAGDSDGVNVIDKLVPAGANPADRARWAYDDVMANHNFREGKLALR